MIGYSPGLIFRKDVFVGVPVVHFDIMGGEGDELQRFYAELFAWKIDSNNPMNYGVVDTSSSEGIRGGVGAGHNGKPRVTVYAKVDDLRATLDRVERLGGTVVLQPSQVPGGPTLAMFADPAGNVTGLMQA